MKLTHKLCGAALLATVGIAVAAPSATKANTEHSGEGKITFTKDTSGSDPIYTPDPDDTGSGSDRPIIDEPGNTDPADRKIIFVSDLDFEVHERLTNSNEKKYFAKAYENAGEEMPNFVKFKDARSEVANNTYAINAQITTQFTNPAAAVPSEQVLNGATITYGNAKVSSTTNAATLPQAPNAITTVTADGKTTVLDNLTENGRTGFGTHDITFGSVVNGTAADSVMLAIPGDVILANGDYQAVITWYIEDTVGNIANQAKPIN